MEVRHALTYFLYAHNLTDPSRSFATDLSLKDFSKNVDWKIKDSKKVVYVNPKCQEIIIK